MRPPFSDSPEFRRLIDPPTADPRPEPDLARIALEIARDAYPNLHPETYLARLDELADRVRDRCAAVDRPRQVLGQINWVLYVEEKYEGNGEDYYDPRNSYLNEVLDRKTGIPITLALVYWRVAERVGLRVGGLNLPGHFMLRVEAADAPIFVDPFDGGELLDRDGCVARVTKAVGRVVSPAELPFSPCPRAVVAARMLSNLKSIYVRQDDFNAALPVQRRLTALRPGDPRELRDLGMICLHVDRPAEAIDPFQAFLAATPDATDADDIRALLQAARAEVARWN